MFRKNSKENKAKLEHKLYLARETPEPIFDLSECNLNNVPNGIYSLCKVFLKEILLLEKNCLTSLNGGGSLRDLSLLKVLNISHNAFTSLPNDIQYLQNLKELYINNNKIKEVPYSICKLKQLEILDVSYNCLKELPNDIGDMISLKILNIQNNCKLTKLPQSLCKANKLQHLELDEELFIYPPTDIIAKGLNAIMQFIADDSGFVYEPSEEVTDIGTITKPELENKDEEFKAKIWELEKQKQRKMQYFLEIEKANEELQRQELELSNAQRANKEKLLKCITEEQDRLDKELNKIQIEKETERFRLIEQLMNAELKADRAIKNLLSANREPLEQLLQQEKAEEERMLNVVYLYNEELQKNDILEEMQKILQQETEKFNEFHKNRIESSQSILKQEIETDAKLCKFLQDQDLHKITLISRLQQDNDLQKVAVGALLERGDARSWGIIQQVRLVEMQLAALTTIEMDKKKLEVNQQLNDLAQKRIDLSNLLLELLEQQRLRRNQLFSTLQSLENSNNSLEDFWLKQYQQLLQKLPVGLSNAQKHINPQLSEVLLMNGVIHCLPFLAKLTQSEREIQDITDGDLLEAGVLNRKDREKILDSFKMYFKEIKFGEKEYEESPTAPPILLEEATAPLPNPIRSINYSECVICMDAECDIIFVPCGHLCCCPQCAIPVDECPLCRTNIQRKITKLI